MTLKLAPQLGSEVAFPVGGRARECEGYTCAPLAVPVAV